MQPIDGKHCQRGRRPGKGQARGLPPICDHEQVDVAFDGPVDDSVGVEEDLTVSKTLMSSSSFGNRGTFERQGTALPSEIEVFTEPFIDARQSQWTAFRNRLQQNPVAALIGETTTSVGGFLLPVVAAVSSGKSSPKDWIAPGPWT